MPKKKLAHLDMLRVLGAIAVLVLHVTDDGVAAYDSLQPAHWWFCVTLNCAMRWAVPIFVMISGALLLDPTKDEPPVQFYKKRFLRIGVPALFWSALYLTWRKYYIHESLSIFGMFKAFVEGSSYYHLWFIYVLVGLYLATPILRQVTRYTPIRQLRIFTVFALALACGDLFLRDSEAGGPSVLMTFVPYLGYYFAGYCLRDIACSRRAVVASWAVFLACLYATVKLTKSAIDGGADASGDFLIQDEFSPTVIAMSVCVFLLVARTFASQEKSLATSPVVQSISSASLGIYLAHPLFLDILAKYDIQFDWHGIWVGIPVCIISILLLGWALTSIVRRIPYIKTTVGF